MNNNIILGHPFKDILPDIDETNVKECKERLSLESKDEEIWAVLNRNIILADALDKNHPGWKEVGYMWNERPTPTLDDFM